MTDIPITHNPDDTEGQRLRLDADAEAAEGQQDTEGHALRNADAEAPEGDDVEAHIYVQEPGGQRFGDR